MSSGTTSPRRKVVAARPEGPGAGFGGRTGRSRHRDMDRRPGVEGEDLPDLAGRGPHHAVHPLGDGLGGVGGGERGQLAGIDRVEPSRERGGEAA